MLKKIIQLNRHCCNLFERKFTRLYWPEHTRRWFNEATMHEIEVLSKKCKAVRVLEVGGIDRPFLEKGQGFEYVGMDIEHRPKCNEVYDEFLVQSVEAPLEGEFDLIISRMVLEHVPNNEKSWAVMYQALKGGGRAVHIFPSGYHPYSLATRLVGNRLQRRLIRLYRPDAAEITGYPAFYDRCSPRQLKKTLLQAGFDEIEIRTNYSAAEYFNLFFPAFVLVSLFNYLCQKIGIQLFCSNVFVVGYKAEKA